MARGIWTGKYTITGKKSFTGRETFGLERFAGQEGPFRISVKFVSRFDQLTAAVRSKEERTLFWLGSWTKRRMEWKLSKSAPRRLTQKTGKLTARYKREVLGGAARAPYRITGYLRNNVRFAVDVPRLTMYAGPTLLRRTQKDTVPTGPNETIPALLDRGGPAIVDEKRQQWITRTYGRALIWLHTGKRISTVYRAFPYVEETRDVAWQKLQERLKKERL